MNRAACREQPAESMNPEDRSSPTAALPGPARRAMSALAIIALAALAAVCLPVAAQQQDDHSALWQSVADGSHYVIMRHALAPHVGNSREFSLDDCTTQRNLSEQGENQARRIGDLFRRNAIEAADVYSSQWCRCRRTGELLQLGPVSDLLALNSYFRDRSRGPQQTAELAQWLQSRTDRTPLVLVTHGFNVSDLTGTGSVSSGEMVIFRLNRDGSAAVRGRIQVPIED